MESQIQIFLACQIWRGLFGLADIYSTITLESCDLKCEIWDVKLKTSLMNFGLLIWALRYAHKFWKDEKKSDFNSCESCNEISFGDFQICLEILKHGNARSHGIFSGGISIREKISSTGRFSFEESMSAKYFL